MSAKTITEIIATRLLNSPDSDVSRMVFGNGQFESISAARLWQRSCSFANALREKNLSRDVVAVSVYHGLDLFAAFLGTLLSDNIPTMIAPPSPRMEKDKYTRNLVGMLKHIAPRVFIADESTLVSLRAVVAADTVTEFVPADIPDTIAHWDLPCGHPRDVAVLQHSSGTTGQQKGVALSHEAILKHHESYTQTIDLNDDDVIISWLPLYHDMGFVAAFLLPLIAGRPFVQLSQFDWVARPYLLLKAIHQHRATLCWMPNFAFAFMATTNAGKPPG